MAVIDLTPRHPAAKSHTQSAPSEDQLIAIADSIPAGRLLPFIRALKREGARLSEPIAVSEARLVLMRMLADRAVNEDARGNVDLALGEFRWGR